MRMTKYVDLASNILWVEGAEVGQISVKQPKCDHICRHSFILIFVCSDKYKSKEKAVTFYGCLFL